jgi:hypothetical protein
VNGRQPAARRQRGGQDDANSSSSNGSTHVRTFSGLIGRRAAVGHM